MTRWPFLIAFAFLAVLFPRAETAGEGRFEKGDIVCHGPDNERFEVRHVYPSGGRYVVMNQRYYAEMIVNEDRLSRCAD